MSLVESVAVFYLVVMAVFSIGFLINWYRNRIVIRDYKRFGFWAGVIFVALEMITLALSAGASFYSAAPLILALGWDILRLWGFVNNGIFFSNQLNIRSFPLLAPRLGLPVPVQAAPVEPNGVPQTEGVVVTRDAMSPMAEDVAAKPIEVVATPLPAVAEEPNVTPVIQWPKYWLNIGVITVAAVAYSAGLFLVTQPRVGLALRSLVSTDAATLTPLSLVILLEFAFVEELTFRLGIQNFLGAKLMNKRYGYVTAIVLTAALWALAHVGTFDPDWIKLAQIFPLGVALGWLYRKQGIESTILVHGLFNLLGALVLPPLYLG